MRDPNRIDFFLAELGRIWKSECPDWRFGQLIMNVFEANTRATIIFSEEDRMLDVFREYFHIREEKAKELQELAQYTYGVDYGDLPDSQVETIIKTRKRGFRNE